MKASKLIKELEKLIENEGDKSVYVETYTDIFYIKNIKQKKQSKVRPFPCLQKNYSCVDGFTIETTL